MTQPLEFHPEIYSHFLCGYSCDVQVKEQLRKGDQYTVVAVVHCETSTGVINPIEELGQAVKHYQPQAAYFVDAMSSFGAVPIKIQEGHIDYLVSSANKCLQGVPGFSYVIARKSELLKCRGVFFTTFTKRFVFVIGIII
jgi:aspartate aminotransferase-like enzyme